MVSFFNVTYLKKEIVDHFNKCYISSDKNDI